MLDAKASHSDSEVDEAENYDQLNSIQNRKQKKAGGWQSMGWLLTRFHFLCFYLIGC